MIVYKIENRLNGKVYVGQTVRSLEERFAEHVRKRKGVIGAAIEKYGIDNFDVDVLYVAKTIRELNAKEIEYIAQFDCMVPTGYNQCEGGGNTKGFHHNEASRRKMGATRSIRFVGEGNPFYGKRHSEASRQKMSEKRKGMAHLTEEQVHTLRGSAFKRPVVNLDTMEVFDSVKGAAEAYGVPATHITRVCKGRRNRTGGCRWAYCDGLRPVAFY